MACALSRSGNIATLTVTADVADIIAMVGTPVSEKRRLALRRLIDHAQDGVVAAQVADAQLDDEVTEASNRRTRLQGARPTGNL